VRQAALYSLSSLSFHPLPLLISFFSPLAPPPLPHLPASGDPSVRQAALYSLSSLSFCRSNKVVVRKADGMVHMLVELAQPHPGRGTSDLSRLMAVRALAVLGENEQVGGAPSLL
jgi:hypothetical protein